MYIIFLINLVSSNDFETINIIDYKKYISIYCLHRFNQLYYKMKINLILLLFLLFSLIKRINWSYFTTWGSSVYLINLPNNILANNSIRQIFRVSLSGNNIRIKFSNKYGKTNLEIKEATLADSISQGTGEIDITKLKSIYFKGAKNIFIPPGIEVYSDLISYSLKALSEIAISIYFGETPIKLTGHPLSKTFSFIEKGNKIYNKKFKTRYKVAHWYIISAIEILSYSPNKVIVCFGDSITDGFGSILDRQNRWPDLLSKKLNLNRLTSNFGVINKGIQGTSLTSHGLKRFSYDILGVKGISHIIVLYGINDILRLNKNSSNIISAYKQIIKEAHNNNIVIYGGTILPCRSYFRWGKRKEKFRQEVNRWIRNTNPERGGFDSFFDFDKFIRDPNDVTKMYNAYDSGDGIHPNPKGFQRMVKSIIKLQIFTKDFSHH